MKQSSRKPLTEERPYGGQDRSNTLQLPHSHPA